jgi:2-keto-4-pentenoate hydratase/2-oxohepta-3-ene-1,7-dioic acid hydratase in catechol pathway
MKIIQFIENGDTSIRTGFIEDETVIEVNGDIFGPYEQAGPILKLDNVSIEAPCRPSKIICLGLNYRDHAEELGFNLPTEPMIFMKPPSAVVGPGKPIIYPTMSRRLDYEAELAVVIGRRARHVSASTAREYILGYTCLNDVTARDLQKPDGRWTMAKGFDTFCPIGPAIITDSDPSDLRIQAFLNGEQKQNSRTSQLVFGIDDLVAYISNVMTLEPGDLIATGTPSGIGPMNPGDEIEIRIQGIGSLVNTIVEA